jgi:hypothetical protein
MPKQKPEPLDWFDRRVISDRLYWRVMGMRRIYPAPPRDRQDRADIHCTISPRQEPIYLGVADVKPERSQMHQGFADMRGGKLTGPYKARLDRLAKKAEKADAT